MLSRDTAELSDDELIEWYEHTKVEAAETIDPWNAHVAGLRAVARAAMMEARCGSSVVPATDPQKCES